MKKKELSGSASSTDESVSKPRNTPHLIGHKAARNIFLSELRADKLPHAWILSGAKGIGKATLAYHFARCLLAGADHLNMPESDPVFRRVNAGSHPDMLVLEPAFDEKKEEQKAEISIEQARGIAEFLSLTPGEGAWRTVIIDSADELNPNAANAMLKILEEPPPRAVLLLISHNPARLLPTIRSRCRMLPVPPLTKDEYINVLQLIAPHIKSDEAGRLGLLCANSPGMALEYHTRGAWELYSKITGLFSQLPALSSGLIQQYADQFGAKQTHSQWRMHRQMVSVFLERLVLQKGGAEEAQCRARLLNLQHPSFWIEWWGKAETEFSLAERLHCDYKTVIIAFFEQLRSQVQKHAHAG